MMYDRDDRPHCYTSKIKEMIQNNLVTIIKTLASTKTTTTTTATKMFHFEVVLVGSL